jgi:hypothetical protein
MEKAMATKHFAGAAAVALIPPLIQRIIQDIDDIIHKEQNCEVLKTDLKRIKSLMEDIRSYSQNQQNELPQTVRNGLESLGDALEKAKHLINRSQQCLCDITLPRRIRKLNAQIDKLFKDLERDFSIVRKAQQLGGPSAVQGTGVSLNGSCNVAYQGRRRCFTLNWKWSVFKREPRGGNAPAPFRPI